MHAVLRPAKFQKNRGRFFDKLLTHRYIGLSILGGSIIEKKIDVRVWTGRSRRATRFHATATVQLPDGSILSGSASAMDDASWGPGKAVLEAFMEAGIVLASTDAVDTTEPKTSDLASLATDQDIRTAIKTVGDSLLNQTLAVVE